MERRTFLASSAATAAALISGVGPAQAGPTADIRLSFRGGGDFPATVQAIIDAFNERQPGIQIETQAPAQDWDEQFQRTMLDLQTGRAPELAVQSYNRVRLVAERKAARPLGPLIAAEKNWVTLGYTDALMSMAEHGGQQWGLPLAISNPVIFYNEDLLGQAGVDIAALGKSWDNVVAAAEKVTALGDGRMGSFFDYTADGNWMFQALLFSLGGRMMSDGEKNVAFDGPMGHEALRIVQGFGEAGQIDMTRKQADQMFISGSVGMFFTSSRRLGNYRRAIGDRFRLGATRLPAPSPESRVPVGGGFLSLTADDPDVQEAAWAFMKFATGPVGQAIVVERTGAVPGNALAVDRLADFYARNPQAKAGLDQLPVMTGWFTFPGPNAIKITEVIFEHLRSVITLRRSPKEVMADMRRDVIALLPA